MKPPFSVRFVAWCEWLLGGLLAFYALMFFVYGFYGLLHAAFLRLLTSLGYTVVMVGIGAGCIYTGTALLRGRRWAWGASWVIGLAVLGFAGFLIWAWLDRAPIDKGVGPLIAGVSMLMFAALGFVSLVLPRTTRYVHS